MQTTLTKIQARQLVYVLTLIIVNTVCARSQEKHPSDTSKVFYYHGKVVNKDSKPLVFAHVINMRRGYATITDSTGLFRMPVVIGDSLRISSIGFHIKYVNINEPPPVNIQHIDVELTKREYDLPTVNIYELRWQVFKSEFMEQEVKEDKVAKRISNWMADLVPVDELQRIYQSTMAPGFRLNYKTKAEKARKKVAALEKKYQIIAPKFNDKMIRALTGLKDDEIYPFLRFCNFQESFLVHATEYEIMERIIELWEEYQKKHLKK